MTKVIVHTDAAPTAAAYSQAVKAGGLVFVAGQGPIDPTTGAIVGTTIQQQTAQCLSNVSAILQAAGSSLEKAVSATFILADPDDFAGMNEEWRSGSPQSSRHARGHDFPSPGSRFPSP